MHGWIVMLALAGTTGWASAQIRFADVTGEAGLSIPLAGMLGHGGAWGDVDGDGLVDLFAGGFCDRPNSDYFPAQGPVPNRLFRNLGNGRFEGSRESPVQSFGRTSGAVFADLDNSGSLELYVANNAKAKPSPSDAEPQRTAKTRRSELYRNERGTLVDISTVSGACPDSLHTARNIGVLDYDADGLLDLFVVEDKFTAKPRSVLLRNEGGLKFRDVTGEAGLPGDIFGLGLAVGDLNGDGRPDFLVGHSNRLFLSQPENRYRESPRLNAIFSHEPKDGEDWACGVAFGDLNRDALSDIVITAHAKVARNRVFLNGGVTNGEPSFTEVTVAAGLGDAVPARCPHVEIQDFDNDGRPDIYISAGWLDADTFTPLIFRNNGVSNSIPRFAAPREIRAPMHYYPAGPSADFDNDGRLDLFLVNWFGDNRSRLLRNDSPARNWLQIQVIGKRMNRQGIGAQVRLTAGKNHLLGYHEISTGYGYASGQPSIAHFGLGVETNVDVTVAFPDRRSVTRKNVQSNQRLIIEEP